MKNLKTKLWLEFAAGFIVIGLALFALAGTVDYWQAWAYLAVTFVTSALYVLYVTSDPKLLETRTNVGPTAEQRPIQKIITLILGVSIIAGYVVSVLDHRFGWSGVPLWLSVAGDILVTVSMWAVMRVFKENSFGSAAVEVSKEQKVVSTGPYAIVRNPMYSCAIAYCIGMVLALGSYWGFIPCILTSLAFVWRLLDEEKLLSQSLPGYREYCAKVRWHLIPWVF